MNKRICLVSLPSPFLIDEKVFPPLGLLYLTSALKYQGIEAHVHDGTIESIPRGFSHYGIGATTPQFPLAVKALKHIKEHNFKSTVIVGGPHATVDPESCRNAGFDSIVVGQGEIGLYLAMVYNCDLISTKAPPYIAPDRTAIDIKSYQYLIDGRLATSVMTSRGCPYNCAFCCKSTGKSIIYPAENVIAELHDLHENYGYDALMFFDDIFIADRVRLHKILKHIEPWGMKWRGFVRADMLVKGGAEMVAHMKKSGCVEVGMGIESGSNSILKAINKGETTDTMLEAIKLLKRANIRTKGFLIVGLPSESDETILETVNFLTMAQLDDVDFSIYTPYKGSPIYLNKDKYDIHWSELDMEGLWYKGKSGDYKSFVWTSSLSRGQITQYRDQLEGTFKNAN